MFDARSRRAWGTPRRFTPPLHEHTASHTGRPARPGPLGLFPSTHQLPAPWSPKEAPPTRRAPLPHPPPDQKKTRILTLIAASAQARPQAPPSTVLQLSAAPAPAPPTPPCVAASTAGSALALTQGCAATWSSGSRPAASLTSSCGRRGRGGDRVGVKRVLRGFQLRQAGVQGLEGL